MFLTSIGKGLLMFRGKLFDIFISYSLSSLPFSLWYLYHHPAFLLVLFPSISAEKKNLISKFTSSVTDVLPKAA
jgi:hypothetical protein